MITVAKHVVGRAAELGALDLAVERLGLGGPAAVMLDGEPGIGKSRLLSELAARADSRGCIVLTGSASELEADLPLWLFVDALEEYVAGLDLRRLESLDDGVRAELAIVFPALSHLAATRGPSLQDERYRTHRALRELLERLAATTPLVLVLDDVHWADAASIDLLAALLRRPPVAPVLIAMAARPRQVDDRLSSALERAHRGGALTRLELRALGREDATQLLGGAVDAARADFLYGVSGGNPFYLEQLARSLQAPRRAAAGATSTTMAGVDVPPAVAASVTEELALLAAPFRRVLEGAAVAGDPFEPELAAAAAAVDEPAAVRAIDDLLAHGLIRTTEVPRRFRFRHPLIRRAVYDGAPGGWVLRAHERCAEALAGRGASAAARAHHVEHAARQGDDAAIALLAEAGAGATSRAPAIAARWFGAALRLLPERGPAERRIGLLTARAGALAATGQLAVARSDLLEAIGLLPEQAVGPRTSLTAACAGIELLLGEHAQARKRLADALERLTDRTGPEAVALMLELATASLFGARYESMYERAVEALEAARPLGDRALTAATLGLAALAAACNGRIAEAEAHHAEAVELVDGLSDSELAARLAAAGYLANAELYLDRYEQAAAHAARGLELAQATGQQVPTLMPALVTALSIRGRLAEVAGLLESALESARISGIPQAIAWTLVNQSFFLMAAGDTEAALACAEESLELTQGSEERFAAAWSGLALAVALLPADDPARAAEVLVDRAGGEEITALPANWRVLGLQLLTRSQVALGQREQAQLSLALAEAAAESQGLPLAAAWADRAAADVALDTGQPAQAAQRALASAAAAERAGAVIEAAMSRTLAGQALALAGDADRAVAELEQAAAALDGCGAPRLRDAAERELRKLGRPVHRRTRKGSAHGTGVETLTERERQVADLVVDRKTNPQIAAELFLSLKTVETHLRNMFRKLDVSSRVELARAVERARRSS